MDYLLDTNIFIYFLKGRYGLVEKIDRIGFEKIFISGITIAELKYGVEKSANPDKNRPVINDLVDKFKQLPIYGALDSIININSEIKNITTEIKRNHNLKLPDAIIAATSYYLNLPLMTADKRLTKLSELNIFYHEK